MQTFTLDISEKRIIPLLYAKQRDVGSKILVNVTDAGEPYTVPEGAIFSVWFSGASGNGNYSSIDGKSAFTVEESTVLVELIVQMLNKPGLGKMSLVMNSMEGSQLGFWNIPYYVEALPGANSAGAENYYAAFHEDVIATKKLAAEAKAICCFGYRYADAEQKIPLNDAETVKMYLFPNGGGYDAVVRYEGPEGQTGEIADYPYVADLSGRKYDAEKISRLHIEKGVTSIGSYFMYKAFNLKHLTFEDSLEITYLGAYAFAYTQISGEYDFSNVENHNIFNIFECCPKLEGVTFSGVTEIVNKKAFQFCLNLRYVDGLTGVTLIGEAAFQYCTSLQRLDVVPGNVTLFDWAFILTPNEAKVKSSGAALHKAEWDGTGLMPFVQNEWDEDVSTPAEERPTIVSLPIPETDNQKRDFYYGDWAPVIHPFKVGEYTSVVRNRVTGGCWMFSLFHVYNIMHPDTPFKTFYDYLTKGIASKKIKVTASLQAALEASEVYESLVAFRKAENAAVTYTEGSDVTPLDLPLSLDFANKQYTQEGTLFWGIHEVLGWSPTYMDFRNGGAAVKKTVLDNLAAGKPVIMDIAGASGAEDLDGDGVYDGKGDAMHAVTAIGYDKETDKLMIIDSTWEYPSDIVPMVYRLPFEALITPSAVSGIWTYEFEEEITMAQIDEGLKQLLEKVNSGFRRVDGVITLTADNGTGGMTVQTVPCPQNAKIVMFEADEATLAAIPSIGTYTVGFHANFADIITGADMAGGVKNVMAVVKNSDTMAGTAASATMGEDGCSVTTYTVKAGTYRWTAYCWNE